ncbi:MAG: peptidase [Brevundimonas sp.]|uniref:Peptidase n=1 Tax=Brevundimonas albigilva TaxID=1312364 RepID=A0ABY4SL26_9CAUL|nr:MULTISPECIES: peptidase [Brevundimonas]MCV0414082.1 peptidase [Brevundimonas sp.]PZU60320.1 MAG: peptidase [Brevundimonas sp.]UQV17845.1 peptidase [Brevundimonas albigilva]URI14242.1 peptidase [Brevundimonas albigilva]
MTYCVGMLVDEGLAMIADTRTNAGVDNISSYRKLHVFKTPGERVLAVATAGNLSVTQTALSMVGEGVTLPDSAGPETLETAPTLFRAAQILGHALASVRASINTPPTPTADGLNVTASMLLGGQIAGGKMGLYLIYGQGNFIECGPDTPYLQIGELKYGKPILDRALRPNTSLSEAVKLGLISFDSTIRSNIAVGPPFDLIVIPRDKMVGMERRIDADDPYFRDLGRRWSEALAAAHRAMPDPTWLDLQTPPAAKTMMIAS